MSGLLQSLLSYLIVQQGIHLTLSSDDLTFRNVFKSCVTLIKIIENRGLGTWSVYPIYLPTLRLDPLYLNTSDRYLSNIQEPPIIKIPQLSKAIYCNAYLPLLLEKMFLMSNLCHPFFSLGAWLLILSQVDLRTDDNLVLYSSLLYFLTPIYNMYLF